MQGPEWNVTGNIKDWDVTARLGELDLPVLVTSGRYAYGPMLVRPLVDGIRGCRVGRVFEDSAHFASRKSPSVPGTLESFLPRVEAPRRLAAAGAAWRRRGLWSLRP